MYSKILLIFLLSASCLFAQRDKVRGRDLLPSAKDTMDARSRTIVSDSISYAFATDTTALKLLDLPEGRTAYVKDSPGKGLWTVIDSLYPESYSIIATRHPTQGLQWVRNKYLETKSINVLWAGVVGDSTTDDTDNINQLFREAHDNEWSKVHFPESNPKYRITSPILINPGTFNFEVSGGGLNSVIFADSARWTSTLPTGGTKDDFMVEIRLVGDTLAYQYDGRITIKDLTFESDGQYDGTSTNRDDPGGIVTYPSGVVISHCNFKNIRNEAIMHHIAMAKNVRFEFNNFENCQTNAMNINGSSGLVAVGNTVRHCYNGFEMSGDFVSDSTGATIVTSNHFYGCKYGITGPNINAHIDSAIERNSNNKFIVTNNSIIGADVVDVGYAFRSLTGIAFACPTTGYIISNNEIKNMDEYGILNIGYAPAGAQGGNLASPEDIIISGNLITNCGDSTNYAAGILISVVIDTNRTTSPRRIIITDNIITNTDATDYTMRRGIEIGSGVENLIISDNIIKGMTETGILMSQAVNAQQRTYDRINIIGNQIEDSGTRGIYIFANEYYGIKNIKVKDNTLRNNGASGMYIRGCSYINISDNIILQEPYLAGSVGLFIPNNIESLISGNDIRGYTDLVTYAHSGVYRNDGLYTEYAHNGEDNNNIHISRGFYPGEPGTGRWNRGSWSYPNPTVTGADTFYAYYCTNPIAGYGVADPDTVTGDITLGSDTLTISGAGADNYWLVDDKIQVNGSGNAGADKLFYIRDIMLNDSVFVLSDTANTTVDDSTTFQISPSWQSLSF